MRIEAETARDYWRQVPDDWRREGMEALRAMIFEAAPDAEETLAHGMLRYGWGEDRVICHLGVQARYVGLYLGRLERLDTDGSVRRAFDCGKACVRVKARTRRAKGPVNLSGPERAEPREGRDDEAGLELLRPLIEVEAARVRRL